MPPRRQYLSDVKKQVIPANILNSAWTLESIEGQSPNCPITMKLLERGELQLIFKGEVYAGDNLWYMVKDSVIEFHTRPMEKLAWVDDNCEMNPSTFALYLSGEKRVDINDTMLSFFSFDKRKFSFKRL